MADRTILNPQYANSLNGLFDGAGTSELSCSALNINNTSGVTQSTLSEVGNGVSALYNKDTASSYPTTVLQLVNATNDTCDLGVSSDGAFEVGLSGDVAISCGGLLLNNASGVLQSTFGNVGNGILTIENSVPTSTFPTTVLQLVNATNDTCDLGVSSDGAFEVGLNSGVAISCGGILLNNVSGVLQSTFGNVGNGVLSIQNSDPASTFPTTVVQLRSNASVTCNLGVGGTDILSVGTTNGSGTVVAASYTGGIGAYYGSITPSTIGPESSYNNPSVTIPGFVGLDTWAYIINGNIGLPVLIWSIIFVSSDAATNTTTFSITLFNPTSNTTYNTQASPFSIIAMAPSV